MEIPAWPASRPIDLGDKPHLDRLFEAVQPRMSELTFAGLYLFRSAHDYRLSCRGESMVVLAQGYDGTPYCLPPLGGDNQRCAVALLDAGAALYGSDREVTLAGTDGTVTISEERDSFDYLYLRDELATLPGSRFHKKRNRIAYFTSRHASETALFQPEHLDGCRRLLETWARRAGQEGNRSLALETAATNEALELAGVLGLEGIVITIDGEVKAFALGERLNRETSVCHFEKADPFMEGLAQLVNREFARLLFSDCRHVNREQDLGLPGLRSAKLSYHPVELVRKYRISPAGRGAE